MEVFNSLVKFDNSVHPFGFGSRSSANGANGSKMEMTLLLNALQAIQPLLNCDIQEHLEILLPKLEHFATTEVKNVGFKGGYSKETLAAFFDHTLLRPTATESEIVSMCTDAIEYGFASVCVNGRWVSLVREHLQGTNIQTCAVVGFPLGAMSTTNKVNETLDCKHNGATEIDMVISIGDVLDGNYTVVQQDIEAVVQAANDVPVKVILETCYLSRIQIVLLCLLCKQAGAAFVKTSTGFGTAGAKVEDVTLMRLVVGDEVGVKASGGIRDAQTAFAMLNAGATRLGLSAGVQIISEMME